MYKTEADALKDLKKMINSQHNAIKMTDACQDNLFSVSADIGSRFPGEMTQLMQQNYQLRKDMDLLMQQMQNLRAVLEMSGDMKHAAEIYGPPEVFGL